MKKEEKLNELRDAIIKEIVREDKFLLIRYDGYQEFPIRLADVLRVIDDSISVIVHGDYLFFIEPCCEHNWNLSKNDLSLQSKDTIDFLAKLILKEDDQRK